MQCSICKKDDELANLKTAVDAAGRNSYAHRRCIDEHNKIATKKLRAVDAAMIATMISDYDLDATDPYVVAEFLRRKKPAPSLTGRLPTADEIAAAACENREHGQKKSLFKRLEEEVERAKAEVSETFITEIAEDLKELMRKNEDACHFTARMLSAQVTWRKTEEALDASFNEYEKEKIRD